MAATLGKQSGDGQRRKKEFVGYDLSDVGQYASDRHATKTAIGHDEA